MNNFSMRFSNDYRDFCKVHDELYSYNLSLTGHKRVDVQAEKFPDQGAIIVENQDGEFVGGLVFHPIEDNAIFVDYFFTSSACRGCGIGGKVLQKLEEFARNQKKTLIKLTTNSFQAPGFYQKMGFVITEEKPSPAPACPDNIHYYLQKEI